MITPETLTRDQINEAWQIAMRMQSDDGDQLAAACEDVMAEADEPATIAAAKRRICDAINAAGRR